MTIFICFLLGRSHPWRRGQMLFIAISIHPTYINVKHHYKWPSMSVHHNQCPWPGSHFGPKCCAACPKMGAFSHFFDAFPISVVQLLTDIIQQLISAAVDFYFSNFRMTEWWWEGMRGEEEKERGGRLSSESWRGKEEKKRAATEAGPSEEEALLPQSGVGNRR